MKYCKSIVALLLLLSLVLTGCAGNPPLPEDAGESEIEKSDDTNDKVKKPEAYSRLTGLPIKKASADKRPIAIMINNLKQALPQFGTANASIIYEALAEGGVTRLLAVYEDIDDIDKIGTIRSSRPYYLDLAQGLDAIYIHMGGSEGAYGQIRKRKIDSFDLISGANNSMYWRDKARIRENGYEHSVFTSGERIMKRIKSANTRTEISDKYGNAFNFADSVNAVGTPALQVTARFSSYKTGAYKYDSASGFYLINQYGGAHTDARVGLQLAFKNIFILRINSYVLAGDREGRLGMDIVGSGSGVYLTQGMSYDIKWSKSAHDKPFVFETRDGSTLNVLRGDSYVAIVPTSAEVKIEGQEP